jgi:hypothetical protein
MDIAIAIVDRGVVKLEQEDGWNHGRKGRHATTPPALARALLDDRRGRRQR